MPVNFDRECFFIAPIGDKGSEIRKRSDGVRDWVVRPAVEAHGLKTVRADDVGEPGQITAQAVQHCLKAKAAVADLTEGNPNVYYELSVRHGAQLPVVLIAGDDTKLPFDISQSRVIFFDHTDLTSAGKARDELRDQIEASLIGAPDNPISDGMRLAKLESGDAEEQTLAVLLDRFQRLTAVTENIDQRLRKAERRDVVRTTITQAPRAKIVGDYKRDLHEIREQLDAWGGERELDLDDPRQTKLRDLMDSERVDSPPSEQDENQDLGESSSED